MDWIILGMVFAVGGLFVLMMLRLGRYVNNLKVDEVHCEVCGVRLLEDKAKSVWDIGSQVFCYFCQIHKPQYDSSYGVLYYRKMQVDVNGKPIGYVKEDSLYTYTAAGRALIDDADAVAQRATFRGEKMKGKNKGSDKKMPKGKCK